MGSDMTTGGFLLAILFTPVLVMISYGICAVVFWFLIRAIGFFCDKFCPTPSPPPPYCDIRPYYHPNFLWLNPGNIGTMSGLLFTFDDEGKYVVRKIQKSDYSYTPTDCVALIKGERVEIKV